MQRQNQGPLAWRSDPHLVFRRTGNFARIATRFVFPFQSMFHSSGAPGQVN
jgi:hypothetical protein